MKWSMDTHKYMSEITRKALQILSENHITGESTPEEIEAVERIMAAEGIYKDFESAKGRTRRALFTYFKAYDCMKSNEELTDVGKAYVDNKLSVQEISFYYVTNYIYKNDDIKYYPLQLILEFITKADKFSDSEGYITPYDFSKIVECDSLDDISDSFVQRQILARKGSIPEINERAIGYDVWRKMISQAGILDVKNGNLVLNNKELVRWVLDAYKRDLEINRGCLTSGVIRWVPLIPLNRSRLDPSQFSREGKALQACLFDRVSEKTINKYIIINKFTSLDEIRRALGLNANQDGFYQSFSGLERLVGHALKEKGNELQRILGEILLNIEVSEVSDMVEIENRQSSYSLDELGQILKNMYDNAENKTTAIHMFGIKYGDVIKHNGYTSVALVASAGINDSYHAEVSKGIRIYDSINSNEYGVKFYEQEEMEFSDKQKFPKRTARTWKRYPLNSILYGAPGTGKTYSTAQYALAISEKKTLDEIKTESRDEIMKRYNALISDGKVVFTTFHQNYGYEDFIQGIRPDITDSNEIRFKNVDGVFKTIADKAMLDADNNYVIIIDEINRANISKVFGELITLIEEDKRWGELNAISATLPSGEPFAVPNNLYILGTMNSADKSISLIDTALRRRFEFIEFVPNPTTVKEESLRKVFEKLNKGLREEFNSPDLLIGHSYFMERQPDDICDIMNRNVIPLLYEYFFDNQKKVEKQVKDAVEGLDVTIETGSLGRITLRKTENGDNA